MKQQRNSGNRTGGDTPKGILEFSESWLDPNRNVTCGSYKEDGKERRRDRAGLKNIPKYTFADDTELLGTGGIKQTEMAEQDLTLSLCLTFVCDVGKMLTTSLLSLCTTSSKRHSLMELYSTDHPMIWLSTEYDLL